MRSFGIFVVGCVGLSFILGAQGCAKVPMVDFPRQTSLVRLIAIPEPYDKSVVRVPGFLHMEFEGNALYLHREDYERRLYQNAVALQIPEGEGFEKYEGQYVLLEGVFRKCDESRSTCMFSGTMSDISHISVLQQRRPAAPKNVNGKGQWGRP